MVSFWLNWDREKSSKNSRTPTACLQDLLRQGETRRSIFIIWKKGSSQIRVRGSFIKQVCTSEQRGIKSGGKGGLIPMSPRVLEKKVFAM